MLTGPRLISSVTGSLSRIVVFLHGYGASGDDLLPIAHEWQHHLPPCVFYAPHAPQPSDVVPFGYQWFSLPDLSLSTIRAGLDQARPVLLTYLKHLLAQHQLHPKDLALVGFSQGSMMALDILCHLPTLGAVVAYSGAFYPPIHVNSLQESDAAVLLAHGTNDTVVPYAAMTDAEKQLKQLGLKTLQTHTSSGLGHGIDTQGLQKGCDFLGRYLSPEIQPALMS